MCVGYRALQMNALLNWELSFENRFCNGEKKREREIFLITIFPEI